MSAWLAAPSPIIEAYADGSAWRRVREAEAERFNNDYRARLAAVDQAARAGVPACCSACGTRSVFRGTAQALPGAEVHREGLECPACGVPGRTRAAFAVLDASVPPAASEVLVPEHGSAAWRLLRRRFPKAVGTEFHPERRPLGRRLWHRLRHGVTPHADLCDLPFPDGRFDALLALDVFEHIERIDAALAESARVLRPGAVLVATAPFDENAPQDKLLAGTDAGGRLRWHGPEDWHRDPLGGRVPCFHRFGWSLPDRVRAAGFEQAHWCRVNAPALALYGLWVLRARR